MIVIEGQIGVGKTTLAQEVAKHFDKPFYPELKNEATEKLLARFYEDMPRYAFLLQVHFLNQRFQKIKDIFRDPRGGVLDRSIYGDKIFADTLAEEGNMLQFEHNEYVSLLNNMLEHVQNPTLLVYLHCSPDTAVERIKKRDRSYESSIPRDYLAHLKEKYEAWFWSYNRSQKLWVDTERFPLDNEGNMGRILDTIDRTIREARK